MTNTVLRLTVLVVGASPPQQATLSALLGADGLPFTLTHAPTTQAAMDLLAEQRCDVVLLCAPPTPDEVCRAVEQLLDVRSPSPVVLLAPDDEHAHEAAAYKAGALDVLEWGVLSPVLLDRGLRRAAEQHELSRRVEQLNVLRRIDRELTETLDVSKVALLALDSALRLTEANAGFIALMEDGHLMLSHISGPYNQDAVTQLLLHKQGLVGQIARTRRPVFLPNVTAEPAYVTLVKDTCALISVPLVFRNTFVGLLNLESRRVGRFSDTTFQLVELISARMAVAVDNARLYRSQRNQLAQLELLYGQVQQLEAMKTDMIRMASHDLRNPLGIIMGNTDILSQNLGHDERLVVYVHKIMTAATRMEHITSDILSLERIERAAFIQQPVHLGEVVRQAVDELAENILQKRQQLWLDVPEDEVLVEGDDVQLQRAIANLVGNAVKYTPQGGSIWVYLEDDGVGPILTVRDDGPGIAQEHIDRLTQPFYRARTAENAHIEGTGLGLHLVERIVRRHGGTLVIKSLVGHGSQFEVVLPAYRSAAARGGA